MSIHGSESNSNIKKNKSPSSSSKYEEEEVLSRETEDFCFKGGKRSNKSSRL